MIIKDYRDYDVTGANSAALEGFENALATFQSWRVGTETHLERALLGAPEFTMAYVLKAYVYLCSRDPNRVRLARLAFAQVSAMATNHREKLHLAAINATLDDNYELAKAILGVLLRSYPRDVLALQVAHAFDYVTGDIERMADRVPSVLPAWSTESPGYHAVLAMHAFSLVECADYPRAADVGRRALELNAFDARAYHALAHVYEMTGDLYTGIDWMQDRVNFWGSNTVVATHCWWHLALFLVARGEVDQALALYDSRVRANHSLEVSDLIDASALLWRIELMTASVGARWKELALAWTRHISDGFCSFNDLHAMLALVGAQDWKGAETLEGELIQRQHLITRHGEITRLIGLPACRAIILFGRGDYARCVELLSSLPPLAHRIGGSHAQRDVLYLTLMHAIQRLRRPQLGVAAQIATSYSQWSKIPGR
jgi:tetratricopeptide (TPR) repeat protein